MRMPTISCPAHRRRSAWPSATVPTSAPPQLTLPRLASAAKNRNGCFRNARTRLRCSGFMVRLRCAQASAPKFLHRLAHLHRRGVVRQCRAVAHRHAVRDAPWQLEEKPAARVTEDAAPHAVEVDRNDRRIDVLHDFFVAAPERQHLPRARDLSLGKNADHLAVANRLAGDLERLDQVTRPRLGGDRDAPHDPRKGSQHLLFHVPRIHDEANRPVGGGL